MELSLGAGEDLAATACGSTVTGSRRLERARFEADRAGATISRRRAREPTGGPGTGTAAGSRPRAAVRDMEEPYDRIRSEQPTELTPDDRAMIMSLASDIPVLWRAPTTTAADRRIVVRHLIERVEVVVQGETECVDVVVHWYGGSLSRHEVQRPVRRLEQLRDFLALMDRVLGLHQAGRTAAEIATRLNAEGFRPAKRRETFNSVMVRQMLSRRFRSGPRPRALTNSSPLGDHEWWLTDLARELDMPVPTVHSWLRRGLDRAGSCPGREGGGFSGPMDRNSRD